MSMVPVYLGLDYHEETIRVCVTTEQGDVLANRNVGNDPGAVRELVQHHGGLVRGAALEACCGRSRERHRAISHSAC